MALAGHSSEIFYSAGTSPSHPTDDITGCNKINGQMKRDLADATDFKNNAGFHARIPLLLDASPSFSGDYLSGDTVQALIRSNFLSGTLAYVTIYVDPGASSMSKGFQYPVYIESYEVTESVDGKAEFSCTTQLSGSITTV